MIRTTILLCRLALERNPHFCFLITNYDLAEGGTLRLMEIPLVCKFFQLYATPYTKGLIPRDQPAYDEYWGYPVGVWRGLSMLPTPTGGPSPMRGRREAHLRYYHAALASALLRADAEWNSEKYQAWVEV